jgi:hypothetical protein
MGVLGKRRWEEEGCCRGARRGGRWSSLCELVIQEGSLVRLFNIFILWTGYLGLVFLSHLPTELAWGS